ncbi:hypothetical protein CR513_46031, partial [Mucuna pruriens]
MKEGSYPRGKRKSNGEPKRNHDRRKATKFLKPIRHSEYKLLDQMNKIPTRISLLSLLINSEGHRNLLLKILNKAHVAQDITIEKFGGIVNNIMTSSHLSFSEEEVPAKERGHNQPLHIVVKCRNYMIARVLIDNGSFLNIMPKTTLDKLYSIDSQLRTSSIVVRAFDGSKRQVMGEITLPKHIRPVTFDITFQVMDILPTYNYLLGRPWIHAIGAVPYSLHQRVKYIANQQLKETKRLWIQSLEIASTIGAKTEQRNPKPSKAEIMAARIDNATLMCGDANESNKLIKGEGAEAEVLVKIEMWIEQEKPKF